VILCNGLVVRLLVISPKEVLEDMLRACSYNNSYQASLKKCPFEALYGRKCRTPLYWDQIGERQVFGPDIIEDVERLVQQVRENLRVAQTRQKSYADVRRQELTFAVDDHVYLKVSPMRGIRRFNMKGKLPLDTLVHSWCWNRRVR
jgi:hypothetical protein